MSSVIIICKWLGHHLVTNIVMVTICELFHLVDAATGRHSVELFTSAPSPWDQACWVREHNKSGPGSGSSNGGQVGK